MKEEITYEEKFNKNFEIDKEAGLKAINNETLSIITMQKRGMCLVNEEVFEFMQVTVYFKKDEK